MTKQPEVAKFTPWTVEHDWQGLILLKEGNEVFGNLVKCTSGTPGSGIPSNAHARIQSERARLIAEAPAMYEMLKHVEGLVGTHDATCVHEKLCAILARIEGNQP